MPQISEAHHRRRHASASRLCRLPSSGRQLAHHTNDAGVAHPNLCDPATMMLARSGASSRVAGQPGRRSNWFHRNIIQEFAYGDPRASPFLTVATALAIAACVTLPSTANASNAPPGPVVSQPVPEQASPNCHDFTIPVMVEGQQRQAVGQMCQQPDGSWRVSQYTPGLPAQVYTLPAQAIYVTPYPYEYYWADFWGVGPPVFAGGSFFVGHRICHFRPASFIQRRVSWRWVPWRIARRVARWFAWRVAWRRPSLTRADCPAVPGNHGQG